MTADTLGLTLAGGLAAASGLLVYVLVALLGDAGRWLAQGWRRWRQPRLLAALHIPDEPPSGVLPLTARYGRTDDPWRGLTILSALGGLLVLVLLTPTHPTGALVGLLAGLIPGFVRGWAVRRAHARLRRQVGDFLLALHHRLVLRVPLLTALHEIAATPAERTRLGVVGDRLRFHVASGVYEHAPADLLRRLATDLHSAELCAVCDQAQEIVRQGRHTYNEALQESLVAASHSLVVRPEPQRIGALQLLTVLAGAALVGLLLVQFALPILAQAAALITAEPAAIAP